MEKNYDKWSRDELLYEVKRLSVELEKVKNLKRLTDDRFVGDGLYQPKSKEENSLKEKRRMVLSEGELELTLEELDAKGCTDIHIQEFGKKANIKIDLNHPLQRNTEQWDKNKVEQLAKELMESDEIKYED